MNKFIYIGIIVIVLSLIGFYTWDEVNDNKKLRDVEAQVSFKQGIIDSLVTSKTREIIKVDTVTKYVTKYKYQSHAVDSMAIYKILDGRKVNDLAWGDFDSVTIYQKVYDDTLQTADFVLPYRVSLWGNLNSVQFSEYTLFDKTVTKEHVVYVPKNVYHEVSKSHLYFYGMFGSSFGVASDYSYEAGLNFVIRNKFGIMGGYQRFEKMDIFKIGFNIKLL